ncbi:MAG: hypothetical protein HY319_21760 [Armatimonadetes bacterium]|nr:hypothetical protein [Armatimonadota bacterium]
MRAPWILGIFLVLSSVWPGWSEPAPGAIGPSPPPGSVRFEDGKLQYRPGNPGVQVVDSPKLGHYEGDSVEQRFPYWMGAYDWPWPYDPLGPYYDPFWRDRLPYPYGGPCPYP